MQTFITGSRYQEMLEESGRWDRLRGGEARPEYPGIWSYLKWRRTEIGPGMCVMEWEPTTDHAFQAGEGWIVHGGMVTAVLDTAMGGATWTLLNTDEVFLTADLRTEFYRPTFPGLVRAVGQVVHKTRRVTFAEAQLFDSAGKLLAGCRATNQTINLSDPMDQRRSSPATPDRG
ncbi:MAG: PaaI family thioesterase [Actinomycetota bacterium]|nr:PaaI family thioesterase [Actinomycetota bacterium]